MANQDATKVVFLLDNNLWCENEEIRDRTVRAIRLAVLKLLTHFACVNGDVSNMINEKMRWGYRIFDSTKECQIYKKRATWLQHTNKNFKEFESHLQEAVIHRKTDEKSSSRPSAHNGRERTGASRLPQNSGVGRGDEGSPRTHNQAGFDEEADDSSSAYALRHALQDVMNDFQWEVPDMCSPVKSFAPNRNLRRRKRADSLRLSVSNAGNQPTSSAIFPGNITDGRQKHRRKEKIVFVAMECPSSLRQLEHFVGDATKLSSVPALQDTMIAKDFLTEFCGKQNASLFWLDTKLMTPSIAAAHKLLNEVLSHVNGQLISVRWLSSRSHTTSCLQAIHATGQTEQKASKAAKDADPGRGKCPEEAPKHDTSATNKKVAVPRSFLPLSSIVNHYVACPDDLMDYSGMGMTSGAFQAALRQGKNQNQTVLCTLHMIPMFVKESHATTQLMKTTGQQFVIHQAGPNTTNSTSQCDAHETNEHETCTKKTNEHAASIPETNQHAAFTLETTSHQTHIPTATTPQDQEQQHGQQTPNVTIRGRVSREDLHLGAFEAATTYACIGYAVHGDPSQEVGNDGHRLSQWFRQAMMSLSKHRQALVVEVSMEPSSLMSLGVLEPLTPGMASLRVLYPKSVLPLTRSLLNSVSSRNELWPSSEEGCQLFSGLQKELTHGEGSTRVTKSSTGHGKEPALGVGCSQEELQQFMERSAQKILQGSQRKRKQADSIAKRDEDLVGCDEEVLEGLSLMDSHSHDIFHPSWLEPWHISAPSRNSCDQVVEQLLSIPENRPSPSLEPQHSEFSDHLKNLIVGEEGSPDSTSLPVIDTADKQPTNNVQKDSGVRQSPRLKRMLSNVGPRTARIIAISRAQQASRPKSSSKEPKEQVVKKKKNDIVIGQLPDFSSVEDLTTHVKQSYDDVVSKHSCALQFTQSTLALVLHFFKSNEGAQGKDGESITNMHTFVHDTLLLNNKQLRERYSRRTGTPGPDDREIIEARLLEIELQTLLRLEMESSAPTDIAACKEEKKKKKDEDDDKDEQDEQDEDDDDLPEALQETVDEAVAMLNTVPIFASMDKLATFLSDVLLANYAETIPYMLRAIYEGLMKPVPPMLLSPSSDTTGVMSVVQPLSYRSVSSGGGSNKNLGSNSNRSRAMVRHPSLADAGPKRIIGVPARKQQERKKPSVKKKKEKQPDETKMVRRNLFLNDEPEEKKLSKRKSVAVMETHTLRRSPRKSLQSGQLILKTRVVKETPGKKQVLKSMLNKLERARKRSTSKERPTPGPSKVMVIEESPEKPNPGLTTNVRRSPRVPTLRRRPSFYRKQEMHRDRLLGARIAGTSPPPVALLGASAAVKSVEKNTSSAKQSKSSEKKMAPAAFLLSQITSPVSSSASFRKVPSAAKLVADSPSRNTRSRSGSTPVRDIPEETSSVASVRTTPRAKARRRLHEFLIDGSPQKTPKKLQDVSVISPFKSPLRRVYGSSAPSPFKSPREVGILRQSPKRQTQAESESQPLPAAISNTPETDEKKIGEQSDVAPQLARKRTPRKVSRKIIPEEIQSTGCIEPAKGESTSTGVRLGADASETSEDIKKRVGNSTVEQSESESVCDINDHNNEQLVKEVSEAKISQADATTVETDQLSIDKIDKETQDDLNENRSGRKRRREASGENGQSTPVSKGKNLRRDVCTPPSVPASKCTTPELINSWPRKKTRYNTPSPCSSKSLNKSPRSMEQTLRQWTSPRNKRQTPPSCSKKGVSSGSGRKRKRQSPAVGSSEKKRRRGSLGKRNSPRAKGSLFDMLAAKAGLEERCASPVFGIPSDQTKLNLSANSAQNNNKFTSGSEKTSKLIGNAASPQSGDSLDEWDRSFSPVFDTSLTMPRNIPQVLNPKSSMPAEMSITDQGLDDDTESDPEIDFPKIKSKSSDCSGGFLSDSEMMIIADKEMEYRDMEETQRHLRSSSHENIKMSDSENRMDSAHNPVGKSESLTPKRSSKDCANGNDIAKSKKVTPGKLRSSRKRGPSDSVVGANIPDIAFSDPLQSSTPPASPRSKATSTRMSDPHIRTGEDDENTKPQEPPQKKKKKRVTLALSLPSSLGSEQETFQTRPSKSLRRSTVEKGWSDGKSPEQTSSSSALGEFSLAGSSMSSADDDVFEQGSASYPSPPDMASTPPAQCGKPKLVTTPLSTSGLFSLMHSPLVASKSKEPRARGRSSRRNLPLN